MFGVARRSTADMGRAVAAADIGRAAADIGLAIL